VAYSVTLKSISCHHRSARYYIDYTLPHTYETLFSIGSDVLMYDTIPYIYRSFQLGLFAVMLLLLLIVVAILAS
jgi:hypothetical protein